MFRYPPSRRTQTFCAAGPPAGDRRSPDWPGRTGVAPAPVRSPPATAEQGVSERCQDTAAGSQELESSTETGDTVVHHRGEMRTMKSGSFTKNRKHGGASQYLAARSQSRPVNQRQAGCKSQETSKKYEFILGQ